MSNMGRKCVGKQTRRLAWGVVGVLIFLAVGILGCGPSGESKSAPDSGPAGQKSAPPSAGQTPAQPGSPASKEPGLPEKTEPTSPAKETETPAKETTSPSSASGEEPSQPSMPAAAKEDASSASKPSGDEEESAFRPEEIERRRKMIEEEMARQEAEWREKQKKRIAELGNPLVENVEKLIRLDPVFPVWADRDNKRVVMVGEVCRREGPLEMFACLRRTKEHESIVVVDTTARIVHAGLLAVGAESGRPVQYDPYRPATGDEIEVTVVWKDQDGKVQTARAQQWVRHADSKKEMEHPWVFAGSVFAKSEETGQISYMADGGDFICVSNFGTAMLDLPVASSNLNAELQFEAFTERIPPEGTPVTVILTPKKKKAGEPSSASPSSPPSSEKPSTSPAASASEKPAEPEAKTPPAASEKPAP